MLSRLSCCALVAGALGARVKRQQRQAQNAIFIAGTPVLNYNLAYDEHANLAEMSEEEIAALEQDWNVFLKDNVKDSEINRLCQMATCNMEGHPEKGGVSYLEVRSTESQLAEIIRSAAGTVQFVEPDTPMELIPEVFTPEATRPWGLDKVQANARTSFGNGVSVYVLDTGVRVTHEDFTGRVVPVLDFTIPDGKMTECGPGVAGCAADRQGHGTHCAGSAAGQNYGVAPAASIKSIKVLGDTGGGQFSWSYQALDYIAASNSRPAVASMSLGGRVVLQGMKNAVDAAVAAGVTVVVAGGNSNTDACGFSPAFVPSAITVGSTTRWDYRSSFSNYGVCTNIWAPGSDIISASSRGDDEYRSLSGTSMACPHVSGAAALVLSQNTDYNAPRVLDELMKNAALGQIRGLKSGDTNALLNVSNLR